MTEEENKAINLLKTEILDNEKLFKEVGCYKFFNEDRINAVKVLINMIEDNTKALKLADSIITDQDNTIIEKNNKIVKLEFKVEEQQKEIKELKEITKAYDSYIGEKMPLNSTIIIADGKYFMNGTFVNKFISKDKIRKLMNQYKENVEESKEKENKEWKNMNEAQKVVHNILKSRWTNYYYAYKGLLGE